MVQVSNFSVANGSGAAVRSGINQILAALASCNAGPTAPDNPIPNMLWFNTTANQLVVRNEANSGWINLSAVASVAGKTGAVTLETGDIGGLSEALAGKAKLTGGNSLTGNQVVDGTVKASGFIGPSSAAAKLPRGDGSWIDDPAPMLSGEVGSPYVSPRTVNAGPFVIGPNGGWAALTGFDGEALLPVHIHVYSTTNHSNPVTLRLSFSSDNGATWKNEQTVNAGNGLFQINQLLMYSRHEGKLYRFASSGGTVQLPNTTLDIGTDINGIRFGNYGAVVPKISIFAWGGRYD